MTTVIIDPGHGGSTNLEGSSANNATGPAGTLEKDLTLDVAIRLRDRLVAAGLTAELTREDDVNASGAERARRASAGPAEVFLSIHFNGHEDPSIQGTETLIRPPASTESRDLAERVQAALVGELGHRDRGLVEGQWYVLSERLQVEVTARCIAEVSFLTDPAEETRLLEPAYRERIAAALERAVLAHLEQRATAGAAAPGMVEALRQPEDLGENDLAVDVSGEISRLVRPAASGPRALSAGQLRRVHVWAEGRVLRESEQDRSIERLADLMPTDLVLVINDHMGRKRHRPFYLFRPADQIARFVERVRGLGITPHLMTFIVAKREWLEAAAPVLLPLCRSAGVESLQFDAEEPWRLFDTDHQGLADGPFADLFMSDKPCRYGLTDIVFHSPRVRPLIPYMDYLVPQGYSLLKRYPERRRDGSPHPRADQLNPVYSPGRTQRLAHRRWAGYGKPLIMGLAAYRQDGAGGLSRQQAMDRAVETVSELRDPAVTEVSYWSLANMRGNRAVWRYVKELAAGVRTARGASAAAR